MNKKAEIIAISAFLFPLPGLRRSVCGHYSALEAVAQLAFPLGDLPGIHGGKRHVDEL